MWTFWWISCLNSESRIKVSSHIFRYHLLIRYCERKRFSFPTECFRKIRSDFHFLTRIRIFISVIFLADSWTLDLLQSNASIVSKMIISWKKNCKNFNDDLRNERIYIVNRKFFFGVFDMRISSVQMWKKKVSAIVWNKRKF